jgi:hypothetical protein
MISSSAGVKRRATATAAIAVAMAIVPVAASSSAASAVSADSIAAHPFLGGGIVVRPHTIRNAAMSFRVPNLRLRCRSHSPAAVRIGVFGVGHHTSPRTGAVTVRRWFAGLIISCANNKAVYEAALGSASAGRAVPGAVIVIAMYGTPCASISIENRSPHGGGAASGCRGDRSGKSYDRTGNRVLIGAHIQHGMPHNATLKIKTSINDRRVGTIPWRRLIQEGSDCHNGPAVDAAPLHRHAKTVTIFLG